MMMEQKRCLIAIEQSNVASFRPKRHKANISLVTKKEKVGERITALQQLVSPYGKTDTASVLLEAMEYIRFLQEQVKVLSAPYLCKTGNATTEDQEAYSLRRKGLCLVPVSCTIGVASSNGADIWAPIKTGVACSNGADIWAPLKTGVASSNGADIWAPIKTASQKF